jgi:vacuolar-type H+-ATPase subunit H
MGFDPVTIAIAGAAFQGISAIRGYQAERKAAKATKAANAAAMSAATEEAKLTREDAANRAKAERENAAKVRSQQLALYLKSGVTLDGSPMLVMNETTSRGEKNAQNILDTGESQAKSLLLRGKAAQQPVQRADFFGTAAQVLGSASKGMSAYKGGK